MFKLSLKRVHNNALIQDAKIQQFANQYKHPLNIIVKKSHRYSITATFIAPNSLVIKAPSFSPTIDILNFLETHKNWIKKQLKILNSNKLFLQIAYEPNKYILFKGDLYQIQLLNTNKIILSNRQNQTRFTLKYKLTKHAKNADTSNLIKKQIIKWLKYQSMEIFTPLINHYIHKLDNIKKSASPGNSNLNILQSQSFNEKYKKLRITSAKTRWGSCTTKGTINLSYKLIALPLPAIHYVIAHEVSHLKYMNHSKNFWGTVRQLYPNYKQAQKILKQEGRIVQMKM